MEKIILVDGNNLLFRSYYATAYNGNFMNNSKGFPTNALFGFTNMINKIILEEKPSHIMVAFDKGKTFRHDKYDFYKGGRIETPDELKVQFPKAKELLTAMGITYYEIDNYEADDIIGTFAHYCDKNQDYQATIISSDKDLLQLISSNVDIKLLKQKDYIRYNQESFKETYGIDPINIIDLKALQGDPSDNIPGVKGIGEKTALKLLHQYKTLNGIYENIDKITGKSKEKLEIDKENAYMSYEIATIVDVPMEINIEQIKYKGNNTKDLNILYEELEFFSFLKKEQMETVTKPLDIIIVKNQEEVKITKDCAIYLEILGSNYHTSPIVGLGIYNEESCYYIPADVLKQGIPYLENINKYTYDLKKTYVALKWQNLDLTNTIFDTMIASSLLEYNVKDDIAYLANQFDADIPFYDSIYGKVNKLSLPSQDISAYNTVIKAKFIYESYPIFKKELEKNNMTNLFYDIEMPLTTVLANMELTGVYVDQDKLREMGEEFKIKIEHITKQIYNHAGCEFNISSPQKLGEILFEKLELPHGKKGKTGYSTAIDVLNKLQGKHPIINDIIEYRMLTKLYSTYVEGLMNYILKDGKIHTIYTQVLTKTGRLSSIDPNLQNIPMRYEEGRLIRKAFIPSPNCIILSSDYSQIELRLLAHIANVESLIKAFNKGEDIHTETASQIFHVNKEIVTKEMRSIAKAVNFGIIYGMSSFGLSESLHITTKEAKEFIDSYLTTYPGIKEYMDNTIASAHEKGYVETLIGRRRTIPELNNANHIIRNQGERIALNTPIQGTSADIIKKAMVEVDRRFKEENLQSKMILQVHDELVFDVQKEEHEKVQYIVKEVMEQIFPLSVPLLVDIEYGENWYQAK